MVSLGAFAPPFRLVGGYFAIGIIGLIFSSIGFYFADFNAISDFPTAGFFHLFLLGFVLSIIIGALYQLTSVITQVPFFTLKGAYLNLFVYAVSLVFFVCGLLSDVFWFFVFGGVSLFACLFYFGICFALSFFGVKEHSFASFVLFVSCIYLIVGIFLGFILVLFLCGAINFNFDFSLLISIHVYFVLGFMFLVILGAASVLLPMFSLAHGLNFYFSKLSFVLYVCAFFALFVDFHMATWLVGFALACFLAEVIFIFSKRVRKTLDYWSINIIMSAMSAIAFIFCGYFDYVNKAVFLLLFGFLECFILAHLYKIVPFLIWYHFVSPFVGKTKVPLLDDMINKPLAYFQIFLGFLSLVFASFGYFIFGLILQFILALIFATNMFFVARYIKFKGE